MNTFVIDYVLFHSIDEGAARSFRTDAESFEAARETFKQGMLDNNLHEVTDYFIFHQGMIMHTNSAQIF